MEVYSVKHKNKKIQLSSSSRGAFVALSDEILFMDGKTIWEVRLL